MLAFVGTFSTRLDTPLDKIWDSSSRTDWGWKSDTSSGNRKPVFKKSEESISENSDCGVFANMLGNEMGDGLFCFGRGTIQSTTSSLRGAMDDCMDLPPLSSETKGSLVFRTTGVSSADEGLLCKNGVTVESVIPDLESLSSEPSEAEYFSDEEVEACDKE